MGVSFNEHFIEVGENSMHHLPSTLRIALRFHFLRIVPIIHGLRPCLSEKIGSSQIHSLVLMIKRQFSSPRPSFSTPIFIFL